MARRWEATASETPMTVGMDAIRGIRRTIFFLERGFLRLFVFLDFLLRYFFKLRSARGEGWRILD